MMIESKSHTIGTHEGLPIPMAASSYPRLVILGGGFAGLNLALGLRGKPFQVVLFDRNNYHTFQPLLYQVATAGLEPDSIAGPLRQRLEPNRDFSFRMGEVRSIDTLSKTIHTEIGYLTYDYLVIALGSRTNYFGNASIMHNAFPLKQIPQALDLRSHILQNFEEAVITTDPALREALMNLVIVGGGPTGVEVAGALGELKRKVLPKDYDELDIEKMNIWLIEGMPRLLNGMSDFSGRKSLQYLKKFDVHVELNTLVTSYDGQVAHLNDGRAIPTRTLVWAAGVEGNVIDGLPDKCLMRGRIKVDSFNRVEGLRDVFAIGDIAVMATPQSPNGHPMLAPVAIQQARHLVKNLLKMQKKQSIKPFKYMDKGSMATIGRNKAVVDLPGNVHLGGFVAWSVWMFIHLMSIIGFRNRLVVLSNWVWNYFTYDRGTRLIIRRFTPKFKRQQP
jgi:NADH:ubiquinone reductase (H+-translocating)